MIKLILSCVCMCVNVCACEVCDCMSSCYRAFSKTGFYLHFRKYILLSHLNENECNFMHFILSQINKNSPDLSAGVNLIFSCFDILFNALLLIWFLFCKPFYILTERKKQRNVNFNGANKNHGLKTDFFSH